MKLRWSHLAKQHRREIVRHIWVDDPRAARRMSALFETTARRLEHHPNIGRSGAVPGTRELIPHPSYRLVYEVGDTSITIHALVHTSRQWPPAEDETT